MGSRCSRATSSSQGRSRPIVVARP
jgi:hypothetical protein